MTDGEFLQQYIEYSYGFPCMVDPDADIVVLLNEADLDRLENLPLPRLEGNQP